MREIVFIQMGQCGNKVGEKVSSKKFRLWEENILSHILCQFL